jgi:phospholipid/cholesterol/gamma-HCH transport system substrate-binding protein
MRRIAVMTALLAAGAVWLTSLAGASDSHTYKVEMYNAFGLVDGSDVRIAGVNAGSVTDLGITPDKRAVLTIETSGALGVLGKDTQCSSEPQSLIAEYFLTCNPKGSSLPEGGTIPASHVKQTVQADLVQNTLREPFRARLTLLINEFGTALAGNPRNLNQAIRLGAPALTQLKQALDILAEQRRTIRDLNANSDTIIGQLAARRQDVVRFIQEARDTAAISAQRRADLSTDFDRLDDFLAELHPTLTKLGSFAHQQRPLLTNLRLAAPGLNTLAMRLPAFNRASERSLETLGQAAVPGRQALRQGKDEIQALAASGRNAFSAADALDKLLLDLDSPQRAVEVDQTAAKSCNDPTKSCYSTGRSAPTGYTGLEGLLNYVYYQTGALNQFDQVGHLLHFGLFDVGASPCGSYNAGGEGADFGVPKAGGGRTTSIQDADPCVSWLGPNQAGINQDPGAPPYESRYDGSACPDGSEDPSLCDPNTSANSAKRQARASGGGAGSQSPTGGSAGNAGGNGTALPQLPPSGLPDNPKDLPRRLEDLLGLGHHGLPHVGGRHGGLPGLGGGGGGVPRLGGGGRGGGGGPAASDLLDFLFAP